MKSFGLKAGIKKAILCIIKLRNILHLVLIHLVELWRVSDEQHQNFYTSNKDAMFGT